VLESAWNSKPRPWVHWSAALPTEQAGQLVMGLIPAVFHYITYESTVVFVSYLNIFTFLNVQIAL